MCNPIPSAVKCRIWLQDFLTSVELRGREEWKLVTSRMFSIFTCEVSSQFYLQVIFITFKVERGQRLIHFLSKEKNHSIFVTFIQEKIASHEHSASLLRFVEHCATLLRELCGIQKWYGSSLVAGHSPEK